MNQDLVCNMPVKHCRLPSFFLAKNTGEDMGDFDGHMCPLFTFSSRDLSSSFCSFKDMGYSLQALGEELGIISMPVA